MALDPIELLIVGAVVVVIFLWGPSKIPEMARSLGRAKKEFDTAQKDLQEVTKQFQAESGLASLTNAASSTSSGTILDRLTGLMTAPVQTEVAPSAQPAPPQLPQAAAVAAAAGAAPAPVAPLPTPPVTADSKSADQVLIDTARQLGIDTSGKTRQEISQEILAKAKAGNPSSSSVPT
jgi:TatA/E family protein of Tat protein translocase